MLIYTLCMLSVIGFSVFYLFFYRGWLRDRRLQEPFPKYWQKILKAQVPLYRKLPPPLKRQLEQHVQLFLAEKSFYGCGGFVVSESNQIRAGEASSRGQVVLAWAECEKGAVNPAGHHNVILHEFAHQLDYLDGTADGAPPLSGEQAQHWQQTMTHAYEHLRYSLRHHQKPWLDPYGATEPAEFFAVLTEAFFQQPGHLKKEQPEVYQTLSGFFRFDPLDLHGL